VDFKTHESIMPIMPRYATLSLRRAGRNLLPIPDSTCSPMLGARILRVLVRRAIHAAARKVPSENFRRPFQLEPRDETARENARI